MAKEKNKVSIITVSYNAVNSIERTIRSVLEQSYKNIEYIVIDGQSMDGTQTVIEKYRKYINYYVCEPDNGIYDAMNKGILMATGDIIGIINSDDWYEMEAVEKVVNCFQSTDAEVVYGNIWNIGKNGEKKCNIKSPINHIYFSMVTPHPSVFVKRSIYKKHGMFNVNYKIAADYELILRFYSNGVVFRYIDEMIANFSEGGVSSIKMLECAEEARRISLCYMPSNRDDILEQIEKKYSTSKYKSLMQKAPMVVYRVIEMKMAEIEKEIIIFGTGIWGKEFYEVLRNCNIPVKLFVDNDKKKWGTKIDGVWIDSPEILKKFDGYVIIAVKNFQKQISEQLIGYQNEQLSWITIDEMIEEICAFCDNY